MTKEKMIKVLDLYEKFLDNKYKIKPLKYEDNHPNETESVSHMKAMIPEMREFIKEDTGLLYDMELVKTFGKVNRWFGFMQGILWRDGYYSLDELRSHNRDNKENK